MVSGEYLRIESQASLFSEDEIPTVADIEKPNAARHQTNPTVAQEVLSAPVATRSPLLPDRHALDLFFLIEPVGDLTFKGDMASFEHPIFSLSTKPDHKIREYEHRGVEVTVTPSVRGLANIYDGDILIYLMSHLRQAMNSGKPVAPTIRFTALDFLVNTNRPTGGSGYAALKDGLERLAGTRISTNIKTGGKEVLHNFGLIDHFTIVKEAKNSRMLEVEIKLSNWLYRAVDASEVLTIHRDYFRLSRGLERKLYQLARKHCGAQPSWAISFEVCHKKSGAQSSMKEFRRMVREIVEDNARADHFPDYEIRIDKDNIVFERRARNRNRPRAVIDEKRPRVSLDTYEKAKAIARGYDVYALEADWIAMWRAMGSEQLKNPDGAFLGYCRHRVTNDPKR